MLILILNTIINTIIDTINTIDIIDTIDIIIVYLFIMITVLDDLSDQIRIVLYNLNSLILLPTVASMTLNMEHQLVHNLFINRGSIADRLQPYLFYILFHKLSNTDMFIA